MMDLEKSIYINELYDLYGSLLTKKQQEIIELYYCDESDTACIKGDNPFYRNAKNLGALALICRIAAILGFLSAAAVFLA